MSWILPAQQGASRWIKASCCVPSWVTVLKHFMTEQPSTGGRLRTGWSSCSHTLPVSISRRMSCSSVAEHLTISDTSLLRYYWINYLKPNHCLCTFFNLISFPFFCFCRWRWSHVTRAAESQHQEKRFSVWRPLLEIYGTTPCVRGCVGVWVCDGGEGQLVLWIRPLTLPDTASSQHQGSSQPLPAGTTIIWSSHLHHLEASLML